MTAEDPVAMEAEAALATLRKGPTAESLDKTTNLLKSLRNARQFGRLCDLAELVSRYRPDDVLVRKLHAQGQIECKRLTVAIDLLSQALERVAPSHGEYPELQGLLGRAYKQLFVDTPPAQSRSRTLFLQNAVAAYRSAYDTDSSRYWHGINLSACASAAQRLQIDISAEPSADYARRVLTTLEAISEPDRDEWWAPTKAEAHLALGQLPEAEAALGQYLRDPRIVAFQVASTARQLREVWSIQDSPAGAGLLQILEANLVDRPGAILAIEPEHLRVMRESARVEDSQLQRVTGSTDRASLRWYRTGLGRAGSVAAICEKLGTRFGTGFAVLSGDFGIKPADEILLLTNWHVLNSSGFKGRTDFGNIEVRFEAASPEPLSFKVAAVIAESPVTGGLDYCLLRLQGRKDNLKSLELTRAIGARDSKDRLYVIGYAAGEELQFSLQDNWLLDHECPDDGKPPVAERRRVHYSSDTAPGSSGSPVFNDYWECIALHHAGSKVDPPRSYGLAPLNDGEDMVSANEGIWIGSIQDDLKKKNIQLSGPVV